MLYPLTRLIQLILLFLPGVAFGQTFREERERDLVLRRALPIYVNHPLGNVSIQGWVQDRIRVLLKFHVTAASEADAKAEFRKWDLITFEGRERFEIRIGHPQGVDLVTKMRERARSSVQVDLEIRAPYQSGLILVMGAGKRLQLEQWRGPLTVSGRNNIIEMSRLGLSKDMNLACLACEVSVRNSALRGKWVVGSKPVVLEEVESEGLSIDAENEEVKVERFAGKLSVHTRSGRLTVNRFRGELGFLSEDGAAFLNQFSGTAEVQTQSGQIMMDLEEVRGSLHLDTEKSDIQVSLPPNFEGGIDLLSLRGEVNVQFPYEALKAAGAEKYGPLSPGRVDGMVGGRHSPLVHAYSKQGGVRLVRKAPAR